MADRNTRWIILIGAGLILVAAGLALIAVGRGCRAGPPPSGGPTSTATIIATLPPVLVISPSATFLPPTTTRTPVPIKTFTATVAPTIVNTKVVTITPSPSPAPDSDRATPISTPALIGHHRVRRGETMYGIALAWEPGRYFAWARDVWEPVCRVNPQIANCRLIYPGDVLGIPQR